MTLRIGMIGPGGMGKAHIERIHTVISGGRVVAVGARERRVIDAFLALPQRKRELVGALVEALGEEDERQP